MVLALGLVKYIEGQKMEGSISVALLVGEVCLAVVYDYFNPQASCSNLQVMFQKMHLALLGGLSYKCLGILDLAWK